MTDHFDHGLDLPFEKVPGGPINMNLDNPLIAFGVHIRAAAVPLTGLTNLETGAADKAVKPAIIFSFVDPAGQFYPPMVLIQDDDQIAKLRPLINQSIHAAREGARNHPENQ